MLRGGGTRPQRARRWIDDARLGFSDLGKPFGGEGMEGMAMGWDGSRHCKAFGENGWFAVDRGMDSVEFMFFMKRRDFLGVVRVNKMDRDVFGTGRTMDKDFAKAPYVKADLQTYRSPRVVGFRVPAEGPDLSPAEGVPQGLAARGALTESLDRFWDCLELFFAQCFRGPR